MIEFLTNLQEWVAGLSPVVAYLGVALVGTIPFVESYLGTVVGVLAGLPVVGSLLAACGGNVIAVLVAALAGTPIARRQEGKPATASSRRAKIVERTEKWGVPLASLLAPTVFAISLTTFIMISMGFDRTRVVVWNIVAAFAWGAVVALLMVIVRYLGA